MNFVCLELDRPRESDILKRLLHRRAGVKENLTVDTNELVKVLDSMTKKSTQVGPQDIEDYYFGRSTLTDYLNFFQYRGDPETISELATGLGVTITTNFTDTDDYHFFFHRITEIKSNMWFVVLTEAGLAFYTPVRGTNSKQIDYTGIVNKDVRLTLFDNFDFTGETGADPELFTNDNIVPDTVADAQKNYVLNKYNALRSVYMITTQTNANPLDYVMIGTKSHVIISKKQVNREGESPLYQCIAVRESNETYTIAGDDYTFPVTALNAKYWGGIEVSLKDTWHYVGSGGGEPAFQNSWVNYTTTRLLRFYKDALGFVHINGMVKNGSFGTLFTLPAGYRISASDYLHYFVQRSNTGINIYIKVYSSGNIDIEDAGSAGTGYVFVDIPCFYVG